ncbi:MAG: SUMF1/EgtB/PvdO family nonheme iron enzyme [Hyphomicrobiaceae bacterium]
MRSLLKLLAACAALVAATASTAQEPLRLALLIGNQTYDAKVGPLKNPHNDIETVGKALESVGFKPIRHRDASRRQVLGAVKSFAAQLAARGPNAIGFFYYSGHGVSRPDDRANYLIPADLKDTESADFWFDAVKLDDILGELERAAPFAAHFVVFDACRNELKLPDKTAVKGFEPIAERNGLFIAFATALGAVASDQGERSGPYAAALAAELVKPGQDHLQLFQNVKENVFAATGRRQVPWERSGLLRRVYFAGEKPPSIPAPESKPAPQLSGNEAAHQAWLVAKDTTDPAVLEAFIRYYGDTFYGELARSRLRALRLSQAGVGPPLQPSAPPAAKPAAVIEQSCDGIETEVAGKPRCLKPKDTFKDCDTCPEMVVVPAGEFLMGSPDNEPERDANEGPQHKVTIAKSFAVGKFEVTFAEWNTCVAAGGCKHTPNDYGWGRGRQPAINVSWNDAKEYIAWLSAKTGKIYRLLTEAEWEYAARAGTTTPFWWGSSITPKQANYDGNSTYKGGGSKGEDRGRTVSVDSFAPNPWGLYNMHGNVWEWVEDCYKDSYQGAPTDGSAYAIQGCDIRVLRGGSWNSFPGSLRSAGRGGGTPDVRSIVAGFRLARTL